MTKRIGIFRTLGKMITGKNQTKSLVKSKDRPGIWQNCWNYCFFSISTRLFFKHPIFTWWWFGCCAHFNSGWRWRRTIYEIESHLFQRILFNYASSESVSISVWLPLRMVLWLLFNISDFPLFLQIYDSSQTM